MKWEELIAEARAAGVLAFCNDGIAVLNRANAPAPENGSSESVPGEDRSERWESREGESKGAN